MIKLKNFGIQLKVRQCMSSFYVQLWQHVNSYSPNTWGLIHIRFKSKLILMLSMMIDVYILCSLNILSWCDLTWAYVSVSYFDIFSTLYLCPRTHLHMDAIYAGWSCDLDNITKCSRQKEITKNWTTDTLSYCVSFLEILGFFCIHV